MLLDVHDVALGHTTKMRWNDADKWIYSEQIVHPPIIDDATFAQAQAPADARRGQHSPHKPHRSKHHYVLRGLLFCGICDRRMQGHWANAAPYYRCRFPTEYGLANHVEHPRNVTLRQDAHPRPLDGWLARSSTPAHLPDTIDELPPPRNRQPAPVDDPEVEPAEDRRTATASSTSTAPLSTQAPTPPSLVRWITEAAAERARYAALKRAPAPRPAARMTKDQIAAIVTALGRPARSPRRRRPGRQSRDLHQTPPQLTYKPQDRTCPRRSTYRRRLSLAIRGCPRGDLNPQTSEISEFGISSQQH